MITNFWRDTGSGVAPWGPFDPDDKLNFSFDAADFLAAAGAALTLQSMVLILDAKLSNPITQIVGTIGTFRIERSVAAAATGDVMKMTVRTTASDGQRSDKTFYLILQDG